MFSFFRSKKQVPPRFELLKRQVVEASHFQRVRQLCLDLENEKASAYEHDPGECREFRVQDDYYRWAI